MIGTDDRGCWLKCNRERRRYRNCPLTSDTFFGVLRHRNRAYRTGPAIERVLGMCMHGRGWERQGYIFRIINLVDAFPLGIIAMPVGPGVSRIRRNGYPENGL